MAYIVTQLDSEGHAAAVERLAPRDDVACAAPVDAAPGPEATDAAPQRLFFQRPHGGGFPLVPSQRAATTASACVAVDSSNRAGATAAQSTANLESTEGGESWPEWLERSAGGVKAAQYLIRVTGLPRAHVSHPAAAETLELYLSSPAVLRAMEGDGPHAAALRRDLVAHVGMLAT